VSERSSPYPGLMPYAVEDAPLFFGRESEAEIVVANFEASRFTLLYGAGGVGKSSLLRAGVQARLARDPGRVAVVHGAWRDDPVRALLAEVERSLAATGRTDVPHWSASGEVLEQALSDCAERFGELFLILDQFEEYLLYHGEDERFAFELGAVLRNGRVRANVLLSIREDALGALDRFSGRIPRLFERPLRVEHLGLDAARAAIEQPLVGSMGIEAGLTEMVLDELADHHGRIQAPYLQMVMERLFAEERARGSETMRLSTLSELGGARPIVARHATDALDALTRSEQATAARILRFLITPSGAKLALTVPDLASYADLPESVVAPVVERLAAGEIRILRQVPSPAEQPAYEIFHSALAEPILAWRARVEQPGRRRRLFGRR
jgi:hypothetical protein